MYKKEHQLEKAVEMVLVRYDRVPKCGWESTRETNLSYFRR